MTTIPSATDAAAVAAPAATPPAPTVPAPAGTPGYNSGVNGTGAADTSAMPPFSSTLTNVKWNTQLVTPRNYHFLNAGSLMHMLENLQAGKPAAEGVSTAFLAQQKDHSLAGVTKALTGELKAAGVDTTALGKAPTVAQFQELPLNPDITNRIEAEGYKLDGVNSVGSMVTTLQNNPPQNELIKTPLTAQQAYAQFQQEWNKDAASKAQLGGMLAKAGLVDTAAPTNAQAGTAFLKMLQAAGAAGQDPNTYLVNQGNKVSGQLGNPSDTNYAFVRSAANSLGVPLTNEQINSLAEQNPNAYSVPGSSDTALRAQIADMYKYDPNVPQTGYASVIEQGVRQAFGDMGVPQSDAARGQLIQSILQHGNFTSSYEANLQAADAGHSAAAQQAIALYPAQKNLINQGLTIRAIADPYLQAAQNVLGVDAAGIDLTDPKWAKVLAGGTDANGKPTGEPINLADWQTHLKTDPTYGWIDTQNARDTGANLASALAQSFGFQSGATGASSTTQSPTG